MQAIFVVALSLLMTLSSLSMALGADARDLQSLVAGQMHIIFFTCKNPK